MALKGTIIKTEIENRKMIANAAKNATRNGCQNFAPQFKPQIRTLNKNMVTFANG